MPALIPHGAGSSRLCSKTRQENKRLTDQKGWNKIVLVCRCHVGNPKEFTKQKQNKRELISEFSSVA